VLRPKQKYSAEAKETILEAHANRMILRGLERVFGVWRGTVLRWLREWVRRQPKLSQTLLPPEAGDVLELDECWSYVQQKFYKRWLWTALCHRGSFRDHLPQVERSFATWLS